jgi:glucose/arabinose dehydrogenase
MRLASPAWILLVVVGLTACGESARFPFHAGVGLDPMLPPPRSTVLPTVNIAPAKGWPAGATPVAADGLKVAAFATGLDHALALCPAQW